MSKRNFYFEIEEVHGMRVHPPCRQSTIVVDSHCSFTDIEQFARDSYIVSVILIAIVIKTL
jgi:hypothetical protein